MSAPRIMVGVSGGVDSSVAAWRLVQQGEPVAGLFMQNWADDGSGDCRAEDDRRDAVAVCGLLGIPFHFRDFSGEYWQGVFEHFLAEYAAGRTPNPDVLCNREVKFKHFLDAARELGAERIATGHYARIARHDGRWALLRGADRSKDQSYFLHQLGQEQLAATLFPIGDLQKNDLRRIARDARLPTHAKKDSTGICFIGERDFREFLGRYLPARTGEIRDPDGVVIAEHPGVFYFTLGQREGLNIGGVGGRRGGGAVVCRRQGCGQQRAVRRPGPRQPVAAVHPPALGGGALDRRRPARPALRLHRADPLPPAGRAVHGAGARRWHRGGALRAPAARRHPRSIAGVV
jgi:tRNA-specific 2-thiouridylase